ncbi:MAG: hypothetical protein ABIJ97_11565, partial [Bacteroidota bacterium]
MKKLILIKTILLFVLFANAQIVNIPDANFKAALVGNPSINTNQDTEIQVSEAVAFSGNMYVDDENIFDLTGIEVFINLTYLNCGWNNLSTLDLSNNTALTDLNCDLNQLSTLDLSNNTFLTSLQCNANQLTSLDLSNNPDLVTLGCSSNLLSILNISNNPVLYLLYCYDNQLTSLDVTNNLNLYYLSCFDNQLTSLDVSNNLNLGTLACYKNQISVLDVSANTALTQIGCGYNLLTTLDLSNNSSLDRIMCEYNNLAYLNVRNGNNSSIIFNYNFNCSGNPNLSCIEVDDPQWSLLNWTNYDHLISSFSSDCSIITTNKIFGEIVVDTNCIIEGSEQSLEGFIVKTETNNFYGITNNTGEYTISTDTGTYQVEQIIPASNLLLINPLCPIPNYHTVHFDSLGMDTTDIDFFNEGFACPYLTIDISSDVRRRCFTNNTYVHYCNDGFADATGVEVHVQLPDYVIFVSASYPYTIDTLGNYIFDIGNLAHGDCGEIHIVDSVACINGITGLTQCTEAWITPANDCANQLDTASYNQWDHSSVMVEGVCVGDSIISFVITNAGALGSGDMQIASEYRIYRNTLLVYTGTFQLLGQEELIIDIPADGATYRLEADQHPMHPGNSHPNETIEECGSSPAGLGFVNNQAMDDEDAEVEIDCMTIIDSYDPNDKRVSPEGITANNFVMPSTSLDYVIRFQNTGSDTAFTVVVVDTLSEHLDISTLQWGISSHPYTIDVSGHGSPVLMFTFNNINLPDSTTNQANSHGFVKFKIAPYDTLVNGTVVENTADIYFDYNIPVITNTTFVTISDTVIYGNPLVIQDMQNKAITDVKIYPN